MWSGGAVVSAFIGSARTGLIGTDANSEEAGFCAKSGTLAAVIVGAVFDRPRAFCKKESRPDVVPAACGTGMAFALTGKKGSDVTGPFGGIG